MSCFNNKTIHGGIPDQSPAYVKHMQPPVEEINPRLLEEAINQIQMMRQSPMSNTDSITITIEARPEPSYSMNSVEQSMQNADAYGEHLMRQREQDLIAQRAGAILQNKLGVSQDGSYDFRHTTNAKRMHGYQ